MADVQPDALGRTAGGELERILVLDDQAAHLAVETVGNNVPRAEHLKHLVIEWRRLAGMDHQRQLEDLGDLLGHLHRGGAPAAEVDVTGTHLDANDDVAVGFDAGDRAVDVDEVVGLQFRHPVAGDQADGTSTSSGAA